MGITNTDFTLFPDLLAIIQADLRADTRAETNAGERYFITANNLGEGVLMNNGLYANIVGGGGGYFVPESLVSGVIAIGQTGTLLTAPEVSGKVYKIQSLYTSANDEQPGMSLVVDGVTVFDEQNLMDITPLTTNMQVIGNSFGVSRIYANVSNVSAGARIIAEIYCSSFSLIKNTGNTDRAINYAYQVGSFK